MLLIMSIIRKETSMIKATISNNTKRNAFAQTGVRKMVRGVGVSKPVFRGLVLNNYKIIASGTCHLQNVQNKDNVIFFGKQNQKEVA